MTIVKAITSKREWEFEERLTELLDSIPGTYTVNYAIAVEGRDIFRSALVIYEEDENETH